MVANSGGSVHTGTQKDESKYWAGLDCWISPCYGLFSLILKFMNHSFLSFSSSFSGLVNRGYGAPLYLVQLLKFNAPSPK
jgi:hypothetical protein